MRKNIFIAGHNGMVGTAIMRQLSSGNDTIITQDRRDLDLTNQQQVARFFSSQAIDQVYLAAARVGGIHANQTYPAEFIYQNLMIETNVIHQAYQHGVKKLLFLGSSCIYPGQLSQPIHEEDLLTATLEPSNEPYAIAKIAGIKLCESYNRQYGVDFRSIMPTNLYGPFDNFHPENSHVIPALMRRFHEAKMAQDKQVVIWGSGNPRREFLYVDDMAKASIFVMNCSQSVYQEQTQAMRSHLNVGTGQDCTIRELASLIADVVGFSGALVFDSERPDGVSRKQLNTSRINAMGWFAETSLRQGLQDTYQWFLDQQSLLRM